MDQSPGKNRFCESNDDSGVAQYRSIEPLSVVSILPAIGSLMALYDLTVASPFFLAAIVVSLISLFRIRSRPEVFLGRKAALFSLGLTLFCMLAGTARTVTYDYMLRRQAKSVGQEFLDTIAQNRPEVAFQWKLQPNQRCRSKAAIWDFYRLDPKQADSLRNFVVEKGVRTLLALGKDAKIYPVGRSKYQTFSDAQTVEQIYAVEFPSDSKTKTFFYGLLMHRLFSKDGPEQWVVADHVAGHDPWKKEK